MSDTKRAAPRRPWSNIPRCADPLTGEPCCPECGGATPLVTVNRLGVAPAIHRCELD